MVYHGSLLWLSWQRAASPEADYFHALNQRVAYMFHDFAIKPRGEAQLCLDQGLVAMWLERGSEKCIPLSGLML
jgi:hypothetical protein